MDDTKGIPQETMFNDSIVCYVPLKCANKKVGKMCRINLIACFLSCLLQRENYFQYNHYNRPPKPHTNFLQEKDPQENCGIASKPGAFYAKLLWHSQNWEGQQQGCASGKREPISGFNFQKEMPCLFHVSLCFRSEQQQKKKKRTKLKPLVWLAS